MCAKRREVKVSKIDKENEIDSSLKIHASLRRVGGGGEVSGWLEIIAFHIHCKCTIVMVFIDGLHA